MDQSLFMSLANHSILDVIEFLKEQESDPTSFSGLVDGRYYFQPNNNVFNVSLGTGLAEYNLFSSVNHPVESKAESNSSLSLSSENLHDSRLYCTFCKNNREMPATWQSHVLRDAEGNIRCPVLRAYRCPRCGDTGDRAHTQSHCPRAAPDARIKAKYLKRRTSTPVHRSSSKKI